MAQRDRYNALIDEYLENWEKGRFLNYRRHTKHVQRLCKRALRKLQVPFICHSRIKESKSLRKKLEMRIETKQYKDAAAIEDDVRDLGGIRIALYHKKGMEQVEKLIREKFEVVKSVKHPKSGSLDARRATQHGASTLESGLDYEERFEGYSACHYYVMLHGKAEDTHGDDLDTTMVVEIQVTSALRHVWATVEHGLKYKELEGAPSTGEKRTLDSLDGLMQAGDIQLEQLVELTEHRIKRQKEDEEPITHDLQLIVLVNKWFRDHVFSPMLDQETKLRFLVEQNENELMPFKASRALKLLLELDRVALNTPKKLMARLEQVNFQPCFRSKADVSQGLSLPLQIDPYGQNLAICIISDILKTCDVARGDHEAEECSILRLSIIGSTLIWLKELFHTVATFRERIFGQMETERKAQLRWLLFSPDRSMILGRRMRVSCNGSNSLGMINGLWSWLLDEPNAMISLAFKLARTGVRKEFPKDVKRLRNIGEKWKDELGLESWGISMHGP